jgi:hypothetical protein
MGFIGKVINFTFLHAGQSDKPTPSFASSAAFKTAIDSQAIQLQTALNGLIDALNSTTPGNSASENLGAAAITGVAGATLYAQIVDLKAQINSAVTGQIPDGTVTPAKLSFDPATQIELNNNNRLISMGGMF